MTTQEPPTNPDNGYEAFLTLGRFLEKDGWHPKKLEEESAYQMACQGGNGRMACHAVILEEEEQFVFYVEAPFRVSEERRLEVAKFITMANYGMRIGNFELDLKDGTVRYKSSLDFQGFILMPNMIKNAIYPAVNTMNEYLPGLSRIMDDALSAEEAIAEIEG